MKKNKNYLKGKELVKPSEESLKIKTKHSKGCQGMKNKLIKIGL